MKKTIKIELIFLLLCAIIGLFRGLYIHFEGYHFRQFLMLLPVAFIVMWGVKNYFKDK